MEKATVELAAFKKLAASALERRGTKRVKETSGEVGVSPNTARLRPRSKLARKKLTFESKNKPTIMHGFPKIEHALCTIRSSFVSS